MFWYFKQNLLYYFNKEYFLELKKFYDKTLYQYIKFCKINNVLYYFNEILQVVKNAPRPGRDAGRIVHDPWFHLHLADATLLRLNAARRRALPPAAPGRRPHHSLYTVNRIPSFPAAVKGEFQPFQLTGVTSPTVPFPSTVRR